MCAGGPGAGGPSIWEARRLRWGLTPACACCMVGRRSTSTGLLALDTGMLSGSVGYQGPLKGWDCLHACLHAAWELGCGHSMGWAGCILSQRDCVRSCLPAQCAPAGASGAGSERRHACMQGWGRRGCVFCPGTALAVPCLSGDLPA